MIRLRPVALLLAIALVAVAAEARRKSMEPKPATAAERFDESLFQALEWRLIGPYRGGRSTAVAGVAGDPFTYYFGGTGGGVWKSTDAGLNWKNVSDGFFSTGSVGAIAVAPSDANVVYVGMGESPVRGVMTTHGDGVYRSTDAGKTWKHLGLEQTFHISRVQVHPHDPDTVWVAAQGHLWGPNPERGIYKSSDGGESWRLVLNVDADTGASDLALDVTNPRILYAAMWQHRRRPWEIESGGPGSGIWKSSDGGESWEELEQGLPELMGKVGVAVSAANPERVWAMIEADDGGLFRSDDGGAKWKRVNEERVLRARAWYYTHVFADPRNENVVWVLNAPAMKSVDGGKTFTRVPTPHGDNHDLWINPEDTRFLINANDGGANVSLNGGKSWSTQANQPTAQFYRVATDNLFPYHVYGGQQDNSAIRIQSRSMGSRIDRVHWESVAGCETSDPAFDPDNPRHVYGGCYQGIISVWDAVTKEDRSIIAYPQLNLSTDPAKQKYRFNWNAPIVASPHDPATVYHAGNVVLKTTDRGVTWQEVSPDLTRDEEERQGPGGRPITSEGAGGEVYNTLLALAESPHEEGVLWAGSDDGLVHLTRDGGGSWNDVTPPGAGEAMINTIEPSPHEAAAAYLAVTRYKWDDLTPLVYKTTDFGATWTEVGGGLPADTIVRVVREDPVRRGLLYAGTERGVFVSWDDGERWQPLELGLPVVPVTDLEIRNDDLVAATQGRAFWILDDLTPLGHLDDELKEADLHLFPPREAVLTGGSQAEDPGAAGKNPPSGLVVHYLVGADAAEEEGAGSTGDSEEPEEGPESGDASSDDSSDSDVDSPPPLVIEVLDADGRLLRRVSSEKPEAKEGESEKPLPLAAGMNRWVWDLRTEAPARVPKTIVFGPSSGFRVGPGLYTIRLSRGDRVLEQQAQVVPDPRTDLTADDYRPLVELQWSVRERLHRIHDAANRIADARAQLEQLLERLGERDGAAEIETAVEALLESLEELDGDLVQRKTSNFQDIINYPNKLNAEYAFLLGTLDGTTPPVNAGSRLRFDDLETRWSELDTRIESALGAELAEVEALLREHEVPRVLLPEPEPVIPED